MRRVRKLVVLSAPVAALAASAAINGWLSGAQLPRTASKANTGPSQDCSARYAALLELAELARRDGKSSVLVARGLSDPGGALSECL